MSTTNEPTTRTRQVAITDHDDHAHRERARDECFDVFLRYYDAASIRVLDHATTADTPDPNRVPSFTVERELGNSTRYNLVECPIDGCHAPFHPQRSASEHFFREHDPTDLGLSPITTPLEDRTRSDDPDPVDAEDLLVDDRDVEDRDEDSNDPVDVSVDDGQATITDW